MAKVIVSFGGQEVSTQELTAAATIVGRDETTDIRIDNLGISRHHCQFIRRGAAFILQDMNSANGTFVNGKRVAEHYLNDGDRVLVGKYEILFRNDTQAAAAPEKPAAPAGELPESMNTYVMDSNQIRAKLQEMKGGPAAPAAVTPGSAPVSAAALAGRGNLPAPSTQKLGSVSTGGSGLALKFGLVISIVISVILMIMVLYLMFKKG
jgi:pSer/pThr/pTyr-binding forkhead associated (FHA) protein